MKQKILEYVSKWESQGYPSGIPDSACANLEALKMAPSYRMICKAIMKNDLSLGSLGYSRPQTDSYIAIKRIELSERKAKIMNVYQASTKRIEFIFENFDNVYVSFSGGKDSGGYRQG